MLNISDEIKELFLANNISEHEMDISALNAIISFENKTIMDNKGSYFIELNKLLNQSLTGGVFIA